MVESDAVTTTVAHQLLRSLTPDERGQLRAIPRDEVRWRCHWALALRVRNRWLWGHWALVLVVCEEGARRAAARRVPGWGSPYAMVLPHEDTASSIIVERAWVFAHRWH